MKHVVLMLGMVVLMGACAATRPDHFYLLESLTAPAPATTSAFRAQVNVQITLPSMVDRSEFIVTEGGKAFVLDHQRWASPLADQMTTILGQDIEAHRSDMVVTNRRVDSTGIPLYRIAVDVVELTMRRGQGVRLETRWRISDPAGGKVTVGREVFEVPASSEDVAVLAKGLSACVGLLSDRLVRELSAV